MVSLLWIYSAANLEVICPNLVTILSIIEHYFVSTVSLFFSTVSVLCQYFVTGLSLLCHYVVMIVSLFSQNCVTAF